MLNQSSQIPSRKMGLDALWSEVKKSRNGMGLLGIAQNLRKKAA
jgi:hypothetical protein